MEQRVVYVNGAQEMRQISHQEEGGHYVPVLREGEQCHHYPDSRCMIVRTVWPDPKQGQMARNWQMTNNGYLADSTEEI